MPTALLEAEIKIFILLKTEFVNLFPFFQHVRIDRSPISLVAIESTLKFGIFSISIYRGDNMDIKEMMKAQLVLFHAGKDDGFFNSPGWDSFLQDFFNN